MPFVTFLAVFLLIASGGLLLFYREVMLKRISEAINPHPKQKSLISVIKQTGFSIGHIVERFDTDDAEEREGSLGRCSSA